MWGEELAVDIVYMSGKLAIVCVCVCVFWLFLLKGYDSDDIISWNTRIEWSDKLLLDPKAWVFWKSD